MPAVIAVSPVFQFFTNSGLPLVGGKLYTYLTGTTTPTTTWQDQGQTVVNINPIILDARGECRLWLDPAISYRLALYDASDSLIYTVDNVSGPLSAADLGNCNNVALGDALVAVRQPALGAVCTTQHEVNYRTLSLRDFGALTDGSDAVPGIVAALAAAKLLGGARILAERGTYTCLSRWDYNGDNITIQGQGPGATRFLLQHADAVGIGMMHATTPGLISNVQLLDCTVDYDTSFGPNPSTCEVIAGEFANGLAIDNVVVNRGGKALALRGCSNVWIPRLYWTASDGQVGTGRVGILLSRTTVTYTAGDKWGKGINIGAFVLLAPHTPGSGTWNVESGIKIECGEAVRVAAATRIMGARRAFDFARTVTFTAEQTRDVQIAGSLTLAERAVRFTTTVLTEILSDIVFRGLQATGTGLANTNAFEMNANTAVTGLEFDGCHFVDWNFQQFAAGVINRLSLTDNRIEHNLANASGFRLPTVTGFVISGNRITNLNVTTPADGVSFTGASSGGAITGNTISGYATGVALANVSTSVVRGNALAGNTVDVTGAGTNAIQGKPIAAKAFLNGANQTTALTTAVKVALNGESFDPFSTFDSTTNYRWTPGVIGTVQISASATITLPAAIAPSTYAAIHKNGVEVARGTTYYNTAASGAVVVTVACVDQTAAVGDYYELFVLCDAAGTKNILFGASLTFFSGVVIP